MGRKGGRSRPSLRCDGGMADDEIEGGRGTALLPGAHRVVRTLDAKEGPFAGTLVTQGDGVAVRVDAVALGGWVGWRFSGAEHVAAPIDVCRRRGGHDALLPWCTDRVLGFLVRRTAEGGALAPGECSTLVISLLRGLDELGEGVDGVRSGVWWLTDGGRPMFVFGDGPDAREGAVEVIQRLREQCTDKVLRRALGAVEEGLGKALAQPRLPRRLTDAWEQELLSVAAPQPLERSSHAPERARDVARAVAARDLVAPSSGQRLRADRAGTRNPRRATDGGGFIHGAVEDFLGVIRILVRGIRKMIPERRTAGVPEAAGADARGRLRRRSFMIAGAAAAIVLVGGLLWPSGDAPSQASDATGGKPSAVPSHERKAEEETHPTTDAGGDKKVEPDSAAGDPVAAVSGLLKTIAECRAAGDAECAGGVAAGSVGVMDALATVEPGSSTAEVVDVYGDVAVMRLSGGAREGDVEGGRVGASPQAMLVLVRADEKWLVRDVYDVADQPE